MNHLGLANAVQYYKNIEADPKKLKKVLKEELDNTSYDNTSKVALRSLIHDLGRRDTKDVLSEIKDRCDTLNMHSSLKQKSEDGTFKNVTDFFKNVFAPEENYESLKALGKKNEFDNFEFLINSLIKLKPSNPVGVYSTLNFDMKKVFDDLKMKHPELEDSQIKSLVSNLAIKLEIIQHSKNADDVQKGLLGLKLLIDHNLKSSHLNWDEVDVFFANTLTKDKGKDLLFLQLCQKAPEFHPEWCYFSREVKSIFPHATEAQVKDLFKELMKASEYELTAELEVQPAALTTTTASNPGVTPATVQTQDVNTFRESKEVVGSLLYIRQEAFKSESKEAFKSSNTQSVDPEGAKISAGGAGQIYASTQQAVGSRTLNPFYANVFMKFKELDRENSMYLDSRPEFNASKTEPSLWSGNSAVTIFASEHAKTQFRTLEKSRLGKLFDSLEQYPNWKIQYPLWNVLSTGFVNAEVSRQVKEGANPVVFNWNFRTLDPTTIGSLIEVTTAMYTLASEGEKNRQLEFKLHPLVSNNALPGKMRAYEEIVIYVDASNFEKNLKDATDTFRIKMDEMDKRKSELEVQFSKIVPNPAEIAAKAKGNPLTPKEMDDLKREIFFKNSPADVEKEWLEIVDSSYAINELKNEPDKIKEPKVMAAEIRKRESSRSMVNKAGIQLAQSQRKSPVPRSISSSDQSS